jgi:hypothetical protein
MKAGTDLQRYIDLLIPHPSKEWTYAPLYIVCLGGGGADNYRDPSSNEWTLLYCCSTWDRGAC